MPGGCGSNILCNERYNTAYNESYHTAYNERYNTAYNEGGCLRPRPPEEMT